MADEDTSQIASPRREDHFFLDDFTDPRAFDDNWIFTNTAGRMYVDQGELHLTGDKVDLMTRKRLAPADKIHVASARIFINGEYQKFGFIATSRRGGNVAYYFDSYEGPDARDHIHVIASRFIDSDWRVIMDRTLDATWGRYHEFAVERSGDRIRFRINGRVVATLEDESNEPLPVGLMKGRPGEMRVDWVTID